jgi:hypothetical protein
MLIVKREKMNKPNIFDTINRVLVHVILNNDDIILQIKEFLI